MDDHELLRDYVEKYSEKAFRDLVERHLPMVYSAAWRMARDAQFAEEIAQDVFNLLAQKGKTIRAPQVIGGWLYNTTRHLAMHSVRKEQRRRERELTALAMQIDETNFTPEPIHESLEPAMAELEESERDALVLRFLENRSFREVGVELGISEDAARMRVNRALEQLRGAFSRQGISITSVLLATALASSTSSAMPTGLALAISTGAFATVATISTAITQTTFTTMNWINTKTAVATIAAAILAGTGTYFVQQTETKQLRAENETLVQEKKKLTMDRDEALIFSQSSKEKLERLRKDTSELMRLRNEVGQLRRQNEAAKVASQPAVKPVGKESPKKSAKYISKEQLVFAGYATPEDALQSMTWGMMSGNYEVANGSLKPEMRDEELKDPKARENFEIGIKKMAPLFNGMEFVAKKILGDDKVEIKLRQDWNPDVKKLDANVTLPEFHIQPMIKIGNEWKLGGSTRSYEPKWDEEGEIKNYSP
ncbi:MAG: sigma-70 family RNA polymerase sigma factor [Verrucomicrobiota bacterium]